MEDGASVFLSLSMFSLDFCWLNSEESCNCGQLRNIPCLNSEREKDKHTTSETRKWGREQQQQQQFGDEPSLGQFYDQTIWQKTLIKAHLTRFVTKHVHTYCTILLHNMWCKSRVEREADKLWMDRNEPFGHK